MALPVRGRPQPALRATRRNGPRVYTFPRCLTRRRHSTVPLRKLAKVPKSAGRCKAGMRFGEWNRGVLVGVGLAAGVAQADAGLAMYATGVKFAPWSMRVSAGVLVLCIVVGTSWYTSHFLNNAISYPQAVLVGAIISVCTGVVYACYNLITICTSIRSFLMRSFVLASPTRRQPPRVQMHLRPCGRKCRLLASRYQTLFGSPSSALPCLSLLRCSSGGDRDSACVACSNLPARSPPERRYEPSRVSSRRVPPPADRPLRCAAAPLPAATRTGPAVVLRMAANEESLVFARGSVRGARRTGRGGLLKELTTPLRTRHSGSTRHLARQAIRCERRRLSSCTSDTR